MSQHFGAAHSTKRSVFVVAGVRCATGTTTHRTDEGASGFACCDDLICASDEPLRAPLTTLDELSDEEQGWMAGEPSSKASTEKYSKASVSGNLCWSVVETSSHVHSGFSMKFSIGGYASAHVLLDTTSTCEVGVAYHYVASKSPKRPVWRTRRPSLLRQVIDLGWAWFGFRPTRA